MKKPVPANAQTGFLLPKTKESGSPKSGSLKSGNPKTGAVKKGGRSGHVLLAHGAGGHKDHPHMLDLAASLTRAGLTPHRFNFPYRAEGRGFPDRMPVLVECFRDHALRILKKEKPGFLILAGHSMGTRAALALAAEGFPCRGLILFSYPLHPPGHPEKLRLDHLDALRIPVLSLSGTKDTFCTPSLMDATVKGMAVNALAEGKPGRAPGRRLEKELEKALKRPLTNPWMHHWIECADHGLQVAKKSGRSRVDVLAEVEETVRSWMCSW